MGKISEGFQLLVDGLHVLRKRPIFLLPIGLVWIIISAITLYIRYEFEFPEDLQGTLLYIYGFLFLFALIICMGNIIMLEFVEQIESGGEPDWGEALYEVFVRDLLKIVPLALLWAFVWFLILLLKVLTSKKNESSRSRAEPSMEDAARTLGGGHGGAFSWFGLGLDMLEKLVRMATFVALPAVTWENKGPWAALGRASEVIGKHPVQFLTTYTLTGVAAFFMALPLAIVFYMSDSGIPISDQMWTLIIIYEGVTWSLSIYLEQMSIGLLYLWHLKWLKAGAQGELSSIEKPDLLDNVYELSP